LISNQVFQQYRLFFCYHQHQKIIINALVNDEKSKRAYDGKTDVYPLIKKMLESGNSLDD
jgi:toxin YhaV